MNRNIHAVALLLLLPWLVSAQSKEGVILRRVDISGCFLDASGAPLQHRPVVLRIIGSTSSSVSTRTDQDRAFSFVANSGSSGEVVFESPGFRKVSVPIKKAVDAINLGKIVVQVASTDFGDPPIEVSPLALQTQGSALSRSIDPALSGGIKDTTRLPLFDDFRVEEISKGRPAPPQIIRPDDRLFRTRIREGAAKGPNFAGHYTIAEWGCGSGCFSIAIIDARDGKISRSPFHALEWGMPVLSYVGGQAPNVEGFKPLEYRLNSRLLVARGCPENKACATYFYEWTGRDFRLIRKVPARPAR